MKVESNVQKLVIHPLKPSNSISARNLLFKQAINLIGSVASIDDITSFLNLAKDIEEQETNNLLVTEIEHQSLAKL